MHLLLFSLLPIHFVRGECPRMEDIPIMIPNYPFDPAPFTCMHFWHDKGADLYLDACNGELLVIFCRIVFIHLWPTDNPQERNTRLRMVKTMMLEVATTCRWAPSWSSRAALHTSTKTTTSGATDWSLRDPSQCITTSGAMSTVAVPVAPRPTDVAASRNLSTVYQRTDMM